MIRSRKWLQISILIGLLAIVGLTVGGALFKDSPIPKPGGRAPEFNAPGLDGQKHTLSDLRGKPFVLNFWGTFCEPCRTEMPALQKQADKWAPKGLVVIGMNVGENAVTVKSFIEQYRIRFPIYFDETDNIRKDFGVLNYPTTFFIRPDGTIHQIKVGQMDEAYIEQTVASMLAVD